MISLACLFNVSARLLLFSIKIRHFAWLPALFLILLVIEMHAISPLLKEANTRYGRRQVDGITLHGE